MTIKEAEIILANEMLSCGEKFTFTEEEKTEAYSMAIKALNAWEEVLNQLHEWQNNAENEHEQKIVYAYFSAISIINQHLAEIEEKEQKNEHTY